MKRKTTHRRRTAKTKAKRTRRAQRGGGIFDGLKSLFTGSSTPTPSASLTTTPAEPKSVELTTLSGTSSPSSTPPQNNKRNNNPTVNNNPVSFTSTAPEGIARPLPSAPIARPEPSAPPAGGSRKKKSKRSKRSMRKKRC